MIAQDTDELSRGLITEGVISVEDMLSFVPIQLSYIPWSDNIME